MSLRRAANVLLVLAATLAISTAWARSSDRNKPMDIDAGHHEGTLDERSPTVLSQGVIITQGTLDIRANRAEISSRNGDLSRVVMTGKPVTMKQEMDDGAPMTARANKIDYDLNTEIVVFTGDAFIKQPRGSMQGQRIVYNMQNGHVESGGNGNGRVQMRIEPRSRQGDAADQDDDN